jgi:GNAT superfamily N-acetyltransferase
MKLLILCSLPLTMYGMYTIEYKKADQINNQQWEVLEQSWISIFCDAYKDFPNEEIDEKIPGNTQQDLAVWLKEQFFDYRTRAFNNDQYEYVLVYEGTQLMGYAMFTLLPGKSMIHAHQVAVMIAAQGKGIGKIVVNSIAQRHSTVKYLVLTTRILNVNAQAFYNRLGFYQVHEPIENVNCNFTNSILLQKDI